MPESAFFCKAVGAATAVLAAGWLTLLPPAGRYFGLRADPATGQPEPEERPAANAARIEQSGDRAKLIFELSAPLDAAAFVLADPDRVIVDLPQTDFALDPETGKAADPPHRKSVLIASFRFGQLAPGKSRIVIDLGAPALGLRAACDILDSDWHAPLVIELAKTDRRSFQAAVQRARIQLAALAQPKKAQKPEPESAKPVIMIDPGHGGIDRGAMVNGLIEKELVFDFAKAVAAKLD